MVSSKMAEEISRIHGEWVEDRFYVQFVLEMETNSVCIKRMFLTLFKTL